MRSDSVHSTPILPEEAAFRNVPSGPGKVIDCTGAIVSLISSGELEPRRRIGEASLAKRLQVSRTAVRSALEHLEAGGLVERRPRAGTYLREVTVEEFADAMDIRAALESLAAGAAAKLASQTGLAGLKRLASQIDALGRRRQEGDPELLSALTIQDLKFHVTLARLSGNRRLAGTLQQLRLLEFTLVPGRAGRADRSRSRIPSHVEIVEAVASGDSRQAEKVVERHILRTKEARCARFAASEE